MKRRTEKGQYETTSKLSETEIIRMAGIGQEIVGAAHCIKNMLHCLQGGLFVARKEMDRQSRNGKIRGFDLLEKNMDRLNDMVRDMLFYSKDREPEYSWAYLNTLVSSAVDLMRAKADQRNVNLFFHASPDPDEVEIDPKGIFRCILNLISNAVDACEPDQGKRVDVRVDASESDYVVIEVDDLGHGIDSATLSLLFQPFFSTKASQGTGLGLSVSQKIVKEHGGIISVDSAPGRGSCFRIKLPKQKKLMGSCMKSTSRNVKGKKAEKEQDSVWADSCNMENHVLAR